MNKILFPVIFSFFCIFAYSKSIEAVVDEYTPHARNYSFSFANGNLLPNWSFENEDYGWNNSRTSKETLKRLYGMDPITGSYVGVSYVLNAPYSDYVPVKAGDVYTLSFYVLNPEATTIAPRMCFYTSKRAFAHSCIDGKKYSKNLKWNFYRMTFTVPDGSMYARVYLSKKQNEILFFDDVVLEKGEHSSNRNAIAQQVAYLDGDGTEYMQQVLIRREFASELLPNECLKNDVVYASEFLSVGARSKIMGGNLVSGDSLFIDNDVTLRDEPNPDFQVVAKNSIRLGDRDSIYAFLAYGKNLWEGNQDYVAITSKENSIETCLLDKKSFSVGDSDIDVSNDQEYHLMPGSYKNIMIRARSTLFLSAGEYYFDSFTLEPTATINFDLLDGNVLINVKSNLFINDNSSFVYDSSSNNFIKWELAQTNTLRLGTISRLAGVFVAPNARIELGHQSVLKGTIYAREVFLMQDSKIIAPAFLFTDSKKLFAVSEKRYDKKGLLKEIDMPYIADFKSEGFVTESKSNANTYYSKSGEGPDAENYAFKEYYYADRDNRLLKESEPGKPWNINGEHVVSSDRKFVRSLDIPSSLTTTKVYSESAPYILSYSKDVEGKVVLSWANRYNQLVQSAYSLECVGDDMTKWKWAIKKYEYTREGKLYRILSPLDVASGRTDFSVITNYDASGKVVSQYVPDKGLTSFFYTKSGDLRMTVSAEQKLRKAASFREFDRRGRVVSTGEVILSSIVEDSLRYMAAEMDSIQGEKREYSGIAYDKISKCFERIKDDSLFVKMSSVSLSHTRGRKVCSWSRNFAAIPEITASQALIADFYSYDSVGRVKRLYRYTGIESEENRKIVYMDYNYDDLNRLSKIEIYDNTNYLLDQKKYVYDEKSRVSSIKDEEDDNIATYMYDDFGRNTAVILGDNLKVEMEYRLHGEPSKMKAVNLKTGNVLYEQVLNYEDVLELDGLKPRFDGKISQLTSYENVVDSTMNRVQKFLYDMSGNMVKTDDNGIEHFFVYDDNGRILSREKNGVSVNYNYYDKSYKLNYVTGLENLDSNRISSIEKNLIYDASGRLIEDKSKNMHIKYDANGMACSFVVEKDSLKMEKINLYDPNGNRVSELFYKNSSLQFRKTEISLGGHKVLERNQNYVVAGSPITEQMMIYGKSSIVGKIRPDSKKEWYIKDYQGSVIMTSLDDRIGNMTEYEPYGVQKNVIVDEFAPAEQYTGKEYDDYNGLYYFGSRYFDPVLGLWITPDPENEFFNPYGRSNDPVNNIDRDGRCEVFCIIVITGAVIGTYIGGRAANGGKANPLDWDWKSGSTYGYMIAGAAIGAAAGAGGYYAAAGAGSLLAGSGVSWLAKGTYLYMSLSTAVGVGTSSMISNGLNTKAFGGNDGFWSGEWGDAGIAALQGFGTGFVFGFALGSASYALGGFGTTDGRDTRFFKETVTKTKPELEFVGDGVNVVNKSTSLPIFQYATAQKIVSSLAVAGSWMLVPAAVTLSMVNWLPLSKIDLGWLNKIPGVHEKINGVDTDEFDMDNHWGKSKKDDDLAKGPEKMQEENDEKHGKGIADQILESVLDRIF